MVIQGKCWWMPDNGRDVGLVHRTAQVVRRKLRQSELEHSTHTAQLHQEQSVNVSGLSQLVSQLADLERNVSRLSQLVLGHCGGTCCTVKECLCGSRVWHAAATSQLRQVNAPASESSATHGLNAKQHSPFVQPHIHDQKYSLVDHKLPWQL